MCNSIIGVFVGAFIVLAALGGIWYNESNSVCTQKAYNDAKAATIESNCEWSPNNKDAFVHISCSVNKAALSVTDPGTGSIATGAYQITATTEMYQYAQTSESSTKKDSVGGGSTTKTCYCWKPGWYSSKQSIDLSKPACSHCSKPVSGNPTGFNTGTTSTQRLGTFTTPAVNGVMLMDSKGVNNFRITPDHQFY
jgi:hypothetical protein